MLTMFADLVDDVAEDGRLKMQHPFSNVRDAGGFRTALAALILFRKSFC